MRLRLDYFDQNESFAPLLPRMGTVERLLKSRNGSNWALFHFDDALEYRGCIYNRCLLRSRWEGCEIGGKAESSVFILLVDDGQDARDGFDVNDYFHVAWGTVPPAGSAE